MSENVISFPAESIANIYKLAGYQVIKSESCFWFNEYRQKYVYTSFPLHRKVAPTEEEVSAIFRQIPSSLALRFISSPNERGKLSCMWNCRKPYSLATLEKKSRNQTRRGLERCKIHPVSFSELVKLGWDAHVDTVHRHNGKTSSLGFDASLDAVSAYRAWGAFIDNLLAAYIVIMLVENYAHIIIVRSVSSLLKYYPNNALVFHVVSELFSIDGIDVISYGWDSLVSNPGLEQFKLGMGFVKEPVVQRIIINPRIKFYLNKPLCKLFLSIVPRKNLSYRFQQVLGLCEILASS